MAEQPYKRRRILIDDGQYRLLVFNLIYFFSILLVIAAALYVPPMIQLESASLSLVQKQAVANHLLSLHTRLWPALLVLFVLLAIHSVFVSHRIWGGLYRFRGVMKAVAEGNLTVRATIRKNDYLWKDADLINKMITSLSARIKNIEDQYSHLNAILAEVKRATNNGSAKEMNRHIEHLRVQMEELKVHLNQFKIPAEGMGEESHPGGKVVSKSTAAGSATTTRLKEGPRREVIT